MEKRVIVFVAAAVLLVSCGKESYKPRQSVERLPVGNEKVVADEQPQQVQILSDKNPIDIISLFDGIEPIKPETKNISVQPIACTNKNVDFVKPVKDGYFLVGQGSGGFATQDCYSILFDRYNRFNNISMVSTFDPSGESGSKIIENWIITVENRHSLFATDTTNGKRVLEIELDPNVTYNSKYAQKGGLLYFLNGNNLSCYDLNRNGEKMFSLDTDSISKQKELSESEALFNPEYMCCDDFGNLEIVLPSTFVPDYIKINKSGIIVDSKTITDVSCVIANNEQYLCYRGKDIHSNIFIADKINNTTKIKLLSDHFVDVDYRYIRFPSDKFIYKNIIFDLINMKVYSIPYDIKYQNSGYLYICNDKNLFCLDYNTMKPLWKILFMENIHLVNSLDKGFVCVGDGKNLFLVTSDGNTCFKFEDFGLNRLKGGLVGKDIDEMGESLSDRLIPIHYDIASNNLFVTLSGMNNFFVFGQPAKNTLSMFPPNFVDMEPNGDPSYHSQKPVVLLVWNGDSPQTATIDYSSCELASQTVKLEPGKPTSVTIEICDVAKIKVGDLVYDFLQEVHRGGD